jgi:hypothetical protein
MNFIVRALAGIALTAAPAAAQDLQLLPNHPMTWQNTQFCRVAIREAGDRDWTNGQCHRIEVSTSDGSHNIHVLASRSRFVYVIPRVQPVRADGKILVTHLGLQDYTGQWVTSPSSGFCEYIRRGQRIPGGRIASGDLLQCMTTSATTGLTIISTVGDETGRGLIAAPLFR